MEGLDMARNKEIEPDNSWSDGVWLEIVCCDGCGRDCHDHICRRCRQDYETPTSDALKQLAGKWDFDMTRLSEDEIDELSDLVMYASREDCPVYRQEKIYEAFEIFFSDFG
jgi:hypothetical protein